MYLGVKGANCAELNEGPREFKSGPLRRLLIGGTLGPAGASSTDGITRCCNSYTDTFLPTGTCPSSPSQSSTGIVYSVVSDATFFYISPEDTAYFEVSSAGVYCFVTICFADIRSLMYRLQQVSQSVPKHARATNVRAGSSYPTDVSLQLDPCLPKWRLLCRTVPVRRKPVYRRSETDSREHIECISGYDLFAAGDL